MPRFPRGTPDHPVTYECVRIPVETPVGVVDGHAMEVRFLGKRFHYIEDDGEAAVLFNLDTGEVEQWHW